MIGKTTNNMNKTVKEMLLSTLPFHTGVVGLLLFKLTGLHDMSWWFVFAPYWFVILFLIGVVILVGLCIFILKTIVYLFLGRKRAAAIRWKVNNYPWPHDSTKIPRGKSGAL